MLQAIRQHIASAVFPPHCLHCEAALGFAVRQQWCGDCVRLMKGQEPASCQRCSAHLRQSSPFADGCAACMNMNVNFDSAVSIGNYQGQLQEIIREMKRSNSEPIANQLGRVLADCMLEAAVGVEAEVLVPMPIHWWKRLRRGFNASSVIADGISRTLKFPKCDRVLRYTRLTRKQGTLSTNARVKNVKDAIHVRQPKAVVGRHVVLVDDVSTSCATANEAAKVLKLAGAKEITLAVVARGVRAS